MKRTALRIGSLLLILVLLLGVLPTAALADEPSIQVETDATSQRPYFLGDKVTVTATLTGEVTEGGDMVITTDTDADWLSGGDVEKANGVYTKTFTVNQIVSGNEKPTFTATYTPSEGEPLTDTITCELNPRTKLTVTVTKDREPLTNATVVLHHQYDVEKNITLNHTSNGVYGTAPGGPAGGD